MTSKEQKINKIKNPNNHFDIGVALLKFNVFDSLCFTGIYSQKSIKWTKTNHRS